MSRQIARGFVAVLFMMSAVPSLSAQGRGGGGGHFGGGGGVMRGGGGGGVMRGGGGGGVMRGGGSPVGVAPGAQFVGRGPAFVGHAPAVIGSRGIGFANVGGVRASRVVVSRPFFGSGFSSFSSPFFWDSPVYPAYVAPSYVEPTYTASPTYISPSVSQNDAELTYQVERLTQEIQNLRQEQQSIAAAQMPPAPVVPLVPTVLVYRDGRRVTIQSYAIVGQTLWIVDESTSVKISLSDLDLDATQRENQSRGVRFLIPRK